MNLKATASHNSVKLFVCFLRNVLRNMLPPYSPLKTEAAAILKRVTGEVISRKTIIVLEVLAQGTDQNICHVT